MRRARVFGARLLCGGKRDGAMLEATLLEDVDRSTALYREEAFGPVAILSKFTDFAAALDEVNDSKFGLGASCWTNDARERDLFIDQIESGLAFINGMVASDPRIPFGGVKQSGYGRELGVHGIREFVNVKTVWIAS